MDQTMPVFGDPNKEDRPTLSVGIVGLEVDPWEEQIRNCTTKFQSLCTSQRRSHHLPLWKPIHQATPGTLLRHRQRTQLQWPTQQCPLAAPWQKPPSLALNCPLLVRGTSVTPKTPLATGSGSAKRRVTTPMRPHKEPPYKCDNNLHSVSIDDIAPSCAIYVTPQAGVYRFQHNDELWGFASNPPRSEGMRILNQFGEWSDSIRRDLEDFHAALVIQLPRVSVYRVLHAAILAWGPYATALATLRCLRAMRRWLLDNRSCPSTAKHLRGIHVAHGQKALRSHLS